MFKYLKIIFFLALIVGAWFFLKFAINRNSFLPAPENEQAEEKEFKEIPVMDSEPETIKEGPIKEEKPQIILLDVPFLAQAPFGQWDSPIYQDACEEASLITAVLWVRGEGSISKEEATEEIAKFAEFEIEKYNNFYDHSTADTAQIMKDYFGYYNIKVKENIFAEDIIGELKNNNLIIVPINGQVLRNPFYTPPGPDRHMLVIIGYDFQTEEFITNDVGTRHGEKFRYKKDILEASIRDYPTGHKEPISGIKKTMIVIWK